MKKVLSILAILFTVIILGNGNALPADRDGDSLSYEFHTRVGKKVIVVPERVLDRIDAVRVKPAVNSYGLVFTIKPGVKPVQLEADFYAQDFRANWKLVSTLKSFWNEGGCVVGFYDLESGPSPKWDRAVVRFAK